MEEFKTEEYNNKLGCYIKWLHGNPNQIVQKMYSMAAFQYYDIAGVTSYDKYSEYLEKTTISIITTSDWVVRIYIDNSIFFVNGSKWNEVINKLKQYDQVQIICINMPRYYSSATNTHQGLLPVMFRYLPLFDPNVGICLFRDIDNIWTQQHQYFIDKWLEGNEEICLFLNDNYKRQQAIQLTPNGVILDDVFYNTILSGLWNIKKPIGFTFPVDIWHRIFAYIESYTEFVFKNEYIGYKFYGNRFIYGFDELALTRILIPIFIKMGLKIYAIPIKIYEPQYFEKLFNEPILIKFLRSITDNKDNIDIIKNIVLNNYWRMETSNAGLAQYLICIITNVYFNLITKKNKFYKNEVLINSLRDKVYPVPLLMGIGLFTFKNYNKYDWYLKGSSIVDAFISTNKKITLDDFTAGSNLDNNGDGEIIPNPYGI